MLSGKEKIEKYFQGTALSFDTIYAKKSRFI